MATLLHSNRTRQDTAAIIIVTRFLTLSLKIPTFLTTVANDHRNVIWILPERRKQNLRFQDKVSFRVFCQDLY